MKKELENVGKNILSKKIDILKRNKGVSMITLVITIIVIIILAAVAFGASTDTIGTARLGKFSSDIEEFRKAVEEDYGTRQVNIALDGNTNITEKEIYYAIATGKEKGDYTSAKPAGQVSALQAYLGMEGSENALLGTEFYEITSDNNVANIKSQTVYFKKDEKHFVTNKGEVFVLPGFNQEGNEDNVWWINESKYYISEEPLYIVENLAEEGTLAAVAKPGSYINYESDRGKSGLTWRVWNVTSEEVLIIPTENVEELTLSGANTWKEIANRDASNPLNERCLNYSNKSLGATARCLNLEDIADKLNDGTISALENMDGYNYGTSVTVRGTTAHGLIYLDGNWKGPEKNEAKTLYRTYYSGDVMEDWLELDYSINQGETYGDLIGDSLVWLGSPCIRANDLNAYFHVRCVSRSVLGASYLFSTSSGVGSPRYALRPVVSLSSTLKVVDGDGSQGDKIQISK